MKPLDPGLRQRVTEAQVARLATVCPRGLPHIVPITFAIDGDTIVTAVDHKPKTTTSLQRLKNVESHPVASVIIDHYDDDWSHLWWIRADGEARIVVGGDAHEQAVSRLADKYQPYRERPPRGPVIALTTTHWATWSAS